MALRSNTKNRQDKYLSALQWIGARPEGWIWAPLVLLTLGCQGLENLTITGAWVRAIPPSRDVTAAYLVIENRMDRDRELRFIESPIAANAELHATRYEDDVKSMVKMESLTIPSRGAVVLEPGGIHIMLFGVNQALAEGDTVQLTLHFADKEAINVMAEARKE